LNNFRLNISSRLGSISTPTISEESMPTQRTTRAKRPRLEIDDDDIVVNHGK